MVRLKNNRLPSKLKMQAIVSNWSRQLEIKLFPTERVGIIIDIYTHQCTFDNKPPSLKPPGPEYNHLSPYWRCKCW